MSWNVWCQQQGGQAGPDNQRGTPRTAGRASQHRVRGLRKPGCISSCQQLRGGAACDLSSCHPPCLETACRSPEALLSKGVKLRRDWQSGREERGCQASRVRYASIAIVDVVLTPWRAERSLAKASEQLSPSCWASERGVVVAGADTRSGFRVPWDGTLGPGLTGLSSGWLWSSCELPEKRLVGAGQSLNKGWTFQVSHPSKRQESMG